jgi:hypothetical protein
MNMVVEMQVVRPYVLEVAFADGARGEVNVEMELWGEVFEPLRDPALFARAALDRELGTVVWPNGADLSPDYLRARVAGSAPQRRSQLG